MKGFYGVKLKDKWHGSWGKFGFTNYFKWVLYKLVSSKEDSEGVKIPNPHKKINSFFSVSAFDHWLNDEEYDHYHSVLYKIHDKEYAERMINFIENLFDNYEIYGLVFNSRYGRRFLAFESKLEFSDKLKECIKPYLYFHFVIPELQVLVYCGLWDYTSEFMCFNEDHKETIKNIAIKQKVHILSSKV